MTEKIIITLEYFANSSFLTLKTSLPILCYKLQRNYNPASHLRG